MSKLFKSLVILKLVPASRIDIAADALNVKDAFYGDENIRFKTDVINMVIPPRMLAERGYKNSFGRFIPAPLIEPFDNLFQNRGQNLFCSYCFSDGHCSGVGIST